VPRAVAAAPARLSAGRPLFRIALEVLLISAGVFLGLAGEQWRERASERSLAQSSLRRFRAELRKNRDSVAAVKDKHVTKLQNLQAYFHAAPSARQALAVPDTALDPAFFEYAAWEVALATRALAYMDQDLALSIAHVYAAQRQLDELTRAITQSMYLSANTTGFLYGVATYFGDCTLHEPRLLGIYDDMLARIDRALGEPGGAAAGAQ
jgi:hypothetical protein